METMRKARGKNLSRLRAVKNGPGHFIVSKYVVFYISFNASVTCYVHLIKGLP